MGMSGKRRKEKVYSDKALLAGERGRLEKSQKKKCSRMPRSIKKISPSRKALTSMGGGRKKEESDSGSALGKKLDPRLKRKPSRREGEEKKRQ